MIFHDVEQGSDIWHELRIGKVTASNYGVIMANDGKAFGEHAKRYALRIALERINGFKTSEEYSNGHMKRGIEQEPIARSLYESENFVNVANGGFFDLGEYGDSPDGLVDDDGVIEIKSVIPSVHYATLKRGSYDPAYFWQLVGHLEATGRKWCDFISYCSEFPHDRQLLVYRLYHDEYANHIQRLIDRRREFIELINVMMQEINGGEVKNA